MTTESQHELSRQHEQRERRAKLINSVKQSGGIYSVFHCCFRKHKSVVGIDRRNAAAFYNVFLRIAISGVPRIAA